MFAEDVLSIGLVAGCLIWIPIAIGVVSLIGWMIQDEVNIFVGISGVLICLAIGVISFVSHNQELAPYLLIASVSIMALLPVARTAREKSTLAAIDLEQLEKAYKDLGRNPLNVGARIKIGKILYSRGVHGQAVALIEDTLKGLPKGAYEEEYRMLGQWKRTPMVLPIPSITCVICETKNQPGEPFCTRCHAPILLHYAKGVWLNPTVFRRLLLIWMACAVSIIGIPFASLSLPQNKSTPVVVLLLSFSAYVVWGALRTPKKRRSK